jgi:acetolactate synthase-1/2/3 large subunit
LGRPPIKVSDYIAEFIAGLGIKHVFAVTGGASIHMIHSIAEHPDIDYVCPHHEQAGAMAADAYSRVTGNLGCAIATSGPGATNLITGIACSWFDSVPTLYLTGQVARFRFKGDTGVRQMGFQETDIVSMVRPITKYAALVTDVGDLRRQLEKAIYIARTGRPGPVLLDIPDDLQREFVDPAGLPGFEPDDESPPPQPSAADIDRILALLRSAKRPVLVVGWGVRLARAVTETIELINQLNMPVCPSWAAADLFASDHPLLAGTFGTHGTRAGNFAVQNADLVLCIGARLSTRETGSPMSSWARGAKTIVVDTDAAELAKFSHFQKPLDIAVNADAGAFVRSLLGSLGSSVLPDCADWRERVRTWRARYPVCAPSYRKESIVNPYVFVDRLSEHLQPDDVILVDTGCAIAWMMQGFRFKTGQRLFHAFNNTPMGYALPGAIGAAFALGKKQRVICVAGDGGLMMNLQEMATVKQHRLPIKLFLMNNAGYSMIQQTQEQWLQSRYYAASAEGGLAFPDFDLLAKSCGFETTGISKNAEIDQKIADVLAIDGPALCNVCISPKHRVLPQSKFGRPIEDAEPLLPREEFRSNMIVEPLAVSLADGA